MPANIFLETSPWSQLTPFASWGVLMLQKLGVNSQLYHANEGHAALLNLQRLVDYVQKDGLSFNVAL